jgi:hypothetical protein
VGTFTGRLAAAPPEALPAVPPAERGWPGDFGFGVSVVAAVVVAERVLLPAKPAARAVP